jgi:hypothetical protein
VRFEVSPGSTYDDWWNWIVERHLAASTWADNPTRGEIHAFLRSYNLRQLETSGSIADFLNAKVDELAPRLRDRLTPHLIRDVESMRNRHEPAMRALLDKLGVEPGIEYIWKRAGGYTAAKIDALADVPRKQFLAMIHQYSDRRYRVASAFFRDFGNDPKPNVTRWRITAKSEPKKPLYEMWSILRGTGTIFRTREIEPVAFVIARECWKGDAKLVADLQPYMPWPVT